MITTVFRGLWILTACVLAAGCADDGAVPVVGTLERDRIALSAEAHEPVVEIQVSEGQRVEPGQTLLQLDNRRAAADLAQARARAEQAQRRLDELLRGPVQATIDEADARFQSAESALTLARRELQRMIRLNESNLISDSELDTARNRRDQARGEVDAARAALAVLLQGTTLEELDQARAAVLDAESRVERVSLTLDRLTVIAPRAAIVEALPFERGETPRAGDAVVVLNATDQPPFARVYIPAALRVRFRPGSAITVRVDHHGDVRGRVRFVASEAAFTPFFALTEHDADRLSYLAEIDLIDGDELPTGVPVRVLVSDQGDG